MRVNEILSFLSFCDLCRGRTTERGSKLSEPFLPFPTMINSALIEKVFKCLKIFAIGNDCAPRCNVHGENKFVLTGEIEIAENF